MLEVTGVASEDEAQGCCGEAAASCCNIEGIVSVDERGQMVLPKELRDKAGIKAGDKLAAVSMRQGEAVCCIALIRVEDLARMVKGMLGPVMTEAFKD